MLKDRSLYIKILEEYKNCIKRTVELIAIQSNTHPIRIAGIYSYLLKNGYLSHNHNFSKKDTDRDVNLNFTDSGVEIICGKGLCRHISKNFNSILQELNVTSNILPVSITNVATEISPKLGKEKLRFYHQNFIPYKKHPNSLISDLSYLIDSLSANHQINIITYQNQTYYLDLCNNFFFQKRDNKNLELCNANELKELGFSKKDYTIPIYLNDLDLLKGDVKKIKEMLQKNNATNQEIISEFYLGKIYAKENKDQFKQLYLENKENYKKLVSLIYQYEKQSINFKKRILNK